MFTKEISNDNIDKILNAVLNKQDCANQGPVPVKQNDTIWKHHPIPGFTRISSPFDLNRVHPVYKTVKPHKGVDFAAPTGKEVYAIADGDVIVSRMGTPNGGAGNFITIQHNNQYTTRYLHLDSRVSQQGDKVKAGDLIGYCGNTGVGTGPHLHFEIIENGSVVNPITFLPELALNNIKLLTGTVPVTSNYGLSSEIVNKYRNNWKEYNYNGDLMTISEEFVKFIYYNEYWVPMKGDTLVKVNPYLIYSMILFSLKSSVKKASTVLQMVLNTFTDVGHYNALVEDGILGKASVSAVECVYAALGEEGERILTNAVLCELSDKFIETANANPSAKQYTRNWLNLAYDMLHEYHTNYH